MKTKSALSVLRTGKVDWVGKFGINGSAALTEQS